MSLNFIIEVIVNIKFKESKIEILWLKYMIINWRNIIFKFLYRFNYFMVYVWMFFLFICIYIIECFGNREGVRLYGIKVMGG